MFNKKAKSIISLMVIAIIVLSLFPTFKGEAKSKMVTMYVITQQKCGSVTEKYSYNSNGLISKRYTPETKKYPMTYKYKGKLLIKDSIMLYASGREDNQVHKYSYDKKNRLSKVTLSYLDEKDTYTYFYNNRGIIEKRKHVYEGNGYKNTTEEVYTYDKGRIKEISGKNTLSKYEYNSHGDLISTYYQRPGYTSSSSYSYKYNKKGNATQKTCVSGNSKEVYKFKYKKIKVPVSYKAAVKKQQKLVVNNQDIYTNIYSFGIY